MEFHLEPWGEIYEMPPGAEFNAVFSGPFEKCDFEHNAIEVEYEESVITLYGISGSSVALFHQGEELGQGTSPRSAVPETPLGGTAQIIRLFKKWLP